MKKKHGNTGNRNAAKKFTADEHIRMRCKATDKARWERQARLAGLTLSGWLTMLANATSDNDQSITKM